MYSFLMEYSEKIRLAGEYLSPEVARGGRLFCEIRGEVVVGGHTDALIPWPRIMKGGRPVLILCGDLVEAVRNEAAMAVAHWWGVDPNTVRVWRRALGVGKTTPGSRRLHQALFDERISPEQRKRGRERLGSKETHAKAAATKRAKGVTPELAKTFDKGRRSPKSAQWKSKQAKSMREQWASGRRTTPNAWTEAEIALLGTAPDAEVSLQTGRTEAATAVKRRLLRIAVWKE